MSNCRFLKARRRSQVGTPKKPSRKSSRSPQRTNVFSASKSGEAIYESSHRTLAKEPGKEIIGGNRKLLGRLVPVANAPKIVFISPVPAFDCFTKYCTILKKSVRLKVLKNRNVTLTHMIPVICVPRSLKTERETFNTLNPDRILCLRHC